MPLCFLIKSLKNLYVATVARVHAFLTCRHSETLSSVELTLVHSTKRYTGELFNSLSETVRRQSSIASLMEVATIMTIRGTAFRPGLLAPKMEGIYSHKIISAAKKKKKKKIAKRNRAEAIR